MIHRFASYATCFAALFVAPVALADDEPSVPSQVPQAPAASQVEEKRAPFAVDPIADGSIIVATGAFAGILELVIGTGEIRAAQIAPNFDRSELLGIDRGAISQNVDATARTLSNVGLISAIGWAVVDPVLTGFREKEVESALVDATIYAESMTVTLALTDLAKIAVRRPRPQAYIDAEAHRNDPNYANGVTDSSLSFFSGHSSMTATVAATATYLAFVRSPDTARPWITLGAGTALTSFVAIERVRGGAHFPTDVIAGAIAGAGVGVCVAHLHRNDPPEKRRMWVGFASENGGGTAQLGGVF